MGYNQWIAIKVYAGNIDLQIAEAEHSWGKFYDLNDKDVEYSPEIINGIRIKRGGYADINACGRSDSASGTTGSFKIFDAGRNQFIGKFSWDCPYKNNPRTYGFVELSKDYEAPVTGGTTVAGKPIGNITITCSKKK